MNNNFTKSLVENICVNWSYFKISDLRNQKLIIALGFTVYLSSFLGGYALYTSVDFILHNTFLSLLIGVFAVGFLYLHDSSLMATGSRRQIYTKVLISIFLAIGFTLTNNATKEYTTLKSELVQKADRINSSIAMELNSKIEDIEQEERDILRRIEVAGETSKINIQPLKDARRSFAAFMKTKDTRIERIKSAYANRKEEAKISDLTILAQQARKMMNGGEGTFIAILMAFMFFIIESLPAVLRIMLDGEDYMIRFLASLSVIHSLRDQKIEQQIDFASKGSNIVKNILFLELINKKHEMIQSNFQNTEEMLILDKRLKILNANINPYTGEDLNEIDLNFFGFASTKSNNGSTKDGSSNNQNGQDHTSKNENHQYSQEEVFDL